MEEKSSELKVANHDVVIAIDFGTRGTGFAWVWTAAPDNVLHNMNWPEEVDPCKKTTTSILFNGHEAIAFGKKAEVDWDKLVESRETDGFYLFKHFKMQLSEMDSNGYYLINKPRARCVSICGRHQLEVVDVISGGLKLIKQHAIAQIERNKGELKASQLEIQWVLTVPAIWNERSKILMKTAARKAQMSNLVIALEPEAASTCVLKQLKEDSLTVGDSYIVVDAGGGTMDIVAHKIMDDGRIEELIPATGGPWGSTTIDEAFLQFLYRTFEEANLKDFLHETDNVILVSKMLEEFENQKNIRNHENRVGKIVVNLPDKIAHYLENERNIDIASKLPSGYIKFNRRNRSLVIDHSLYSTFIDVPVKSTRRCMEKLLSSVEKVKYVLLVGGFARCPELVDELSSVCRNYNICLKNPDMIPPDLAVVYGAAMGDHIAIRKARFSFGIESLYDDVGIFTYLVKRGETMLTSQEVVYYAIPQHPRATHIELRILMSPEEIVNNADDPGVQELGKTVIQPSLGKRISQDDVLQCNFSFGGTSIEARVMNQDLGINSKMEVKLPQE